MFPIRLLFALTALQWLVSAQGNLPAPPAIRTGGIVNAASRMPPELPAGAIAQGSLFAIRVFRVGPKNGLKIRITNKAASLETPLVSATDEEIEAVMPDNAPLGTAELTILRNGKAGQPAPVRVVRSSFGIFSRDKLGWGSGEILNADGQPNTIAHAAAPGERVTIFGAGLGAERSARPEILVGGRRVIKILQAAKIPARPGVDQIEFTLPADTPEGCYIPLRLRVAEIVSNTVTVAVSRHTGGCREADHWIPPATSQPGAAALLAFVSANLRLKLGPIGPSAFPMDAAYASFEAGSPETGTNLFSLSPPAGTCTTYAGAWQVSSFLSPLKVLDLDSGHPLDAGPNILLQGPSESRTLMKSSKRLGRYSAFLGGVLPLPIRPPGPLFLTPGMYRITVPGGKDVGAFQISAEVPQPLTWTAPAQATAPAQPEAVDRAKGVTVEWRAANPADRVLIAAMNMDPHGGSTGVCLCAENAAAGSFVILPDALANIPPTPAVPSPSAEPFSLMLIAELSVQSQTPTPAVRGLGSVWLFVASVVGGPTIFH